MSLSRICTSVGTLPPVPPSPTYIADIQLFRNESFESSSWEPSTQTRTSDEFPCWPTKEKPLKRSQSAAIFRRPVIVACSPGYASIVIIPVDVPPREATSQSEY